MSSGRWSIIPDQEIYANAVMSNYIEFDSGHDILEGVLVYKIQRRQYAESDKSFQDESKYTQLLVAWHFKHTKVLYVRALLVEHDKELDENKLRWLHQKYWNLFKAQIHPIGSNWLLDDATMLATTVNVMNGGYRWDIFISEGIRNNIKGPFWIDVER
jgi:hypothetical protein